jgi:hypothetical protein
MDQTMDRSASERGPWSTGLALVVALAPLAIGVAIGIAMDGRSGLGPFSSATLVYWVILPLAALYPTIAAIARRMAYAPTTVLVVASIAPAMIYATVSAIQRLPTDGQRHAVPLTLSTVLERAVPPALLAVGTFLAIEIAAAAIKRGVAIGFFGAIAAAMVFAASFYLGVQVFVPPTT